jgi:hypothetical protein
MDVKTSPLALLKDPSLPYNRRLDQRSVGQGLHPI